MCWEMCLPLLLDIDMKEVFFLWGEARNFWLISKKKSNAYCIDMYNLIKSMGKEQKAPAGFPNDTEIMETEDVVTDTGSHAVGEKTTV